jgi:hypothetical protein
MDGFVFTGFPDASTVFPDASTVFPDASEENMLLILSNIPPDASVTGFPDASTVFPDASVEEENGDERLNASLCLFDENNVLIGVAPFKNDFIILFILINYYKNYYY